MFEMISWSTWPLFSFRSSGDYRKRFIWFDGLTVFLAQEIIDFINLNRNIIIFEVFGATWRFLLYEMGGITRSFGKNWKSTFIYKMYMYSRVLFWILLVSPYREMFLDLPWNWKSVLTIVSRQAARMTAQIF